MSAPKAVTFNIREQSERYVTPLNLHWAGIALLGLVNLYLLIHIGVLWQRVQSGNDEAVAQQQLRLKAAEISARPLDGLDEKLKRADLESETFYAERLPVSYSEIATELGAIARREKVNLSRVAYAQEPVTTQLAGPVTEVRMDAGLTGDYRGLVEFINGLERDKVFFIISGVTLTGQESGRVSLRLKLGTYLRGLSSDEEAERASTPVKVLDQTPDSAPADSVPASAPGTTIPVPVAPARTSGGPR